MDHPVMTGALMSLVTAFRVVLLILELIIGALFVGALVEILTWQPGGTGLFDLPDRAAQLVLIAGCGSVLACLFRVSLPFHRVRDCLELIALAFIGFTVLGSYLMWVLG